MGLLYSLIWLTLKTLVSALDKLNCIMCFCNFFMNVCLYFSSFAQHYSFVLTSVDSKYTFCFCRFDPKSNTTLVLLSHLPWHDIFYK